MHYYPQYPQSSQPPQQQIQQQSLIQGQLVVQQQIAETYATIGAEFERLAILLGAPIERIFRNWSDYEKITKKAEDMNLLMAKIKEMHRVLNNMLIDQKAKYGKIVSIPEILPLENVEAIKTWMGNVEIYVTKIPVLKPYFDLLKSTLNSGKKVYFEKKEMEEEFNKQSKPLIKEKEKQELIVDQKGLPKQAKPNGKPTMQDQNGAIQNWAYAQEFAEANEKERLRIIQKYGEPTLDFKKVDQSGERIEKYYENIDPK